MTKASILLVEDDKNFGLVLHDYLQLHGYQITLKPDGEEGLAALKNDTYDLCILDVMMPKKDGFTLAKEMKQLKLSTPFIFLTAKALKEDMLIGYKSGADDYIIKPFDSEVLLLKINAILKRHQPSTAILPEVFRISETTLHTTNRTLQVGNTSFQLSPKECALLTVLMSQPNEVVARTKVLNDLWKEDNYFTARSMDVYLTKLRKYLQADKQISINNLHGSGFILQVKKD